MDQYIITLFNWARSVPILFRFTLGVRILLAVAFIPTGAVKLLGLRFATGLPEENMIASFFEILYLSVLYWKFLGGAQVLAGILLLWDKTVAIGSIIFLAIALNILFITISYDFGLTNLVSFGITISSIWLLFWNWHKVRHLLFEKPRIEIQVTYQGLVGKFEKGVYVTGFLSGLIFFSVARGFILPISIIYTVVLIGLLSFISAIILAIRNYKISNSED